MKKNETWKPIKEDARYFVSDQGNVYSTITNKMLSQKVRSNTCPYYYVSFRKNGKLKHKNVHRLVAEAFVENPHKKPCVNHIDGNKLNNRAENLEWVTDAENQQHAFSMGLSKTPSNRIEKAIASRQRRVKNITTGEIFESIVESAKAIGGQHSGVSKCLNGTRKHYKGCQFAYEREE